MVIGATYPNAIKVDVINPDAAAITNVWDELCYCSRLIWLHLQDMHIDGRFDTYVQQRWVRFRTIRLFNCSIDDDGIEALAYCDFVVELTIQYATMKLTEAQVATLFAGRNLRVLDRVILAGLLADDVTATTLASIGTLHRLDHLSLGGNACVTDDALHGIATSGRAVQRLVSQRQGVPQLQRRGPAQHRALHAAQDAVSVEL